MSGPPSGIPPAILSFITGRPGFRPPGGPPTGFTPPPLTGTTPTPSPTPTSTESPTSTPSPGSSTEIPLAQTSPPASVGNLNTQSQQSHQSSSLIGPIVGGVVGALILLALIIAWRGVVWVRKRKRQSQAEKGSTDTEAGPSAPGLLHTSGTLNGHPGTVKLNANGYLNCSVTPYSYNPPAELISATTLISSSGTPWQKKTVGYGVDSMLIGHNSVDPEARSLARSASIWTADSKHASTMTSTSTIIAQSPGGFSPTSELQTPIAVRVDPSMRISHNHPPLEVVIERPIGGEDIPPPYQREMV
ncbi:hypothetical protein CVT24_008611 [Panaeolus cyanescens]|uniref:Uncharacterized protein n=1 Tax=Panaeolus cyanescens TaxID=181874 RepID=A0A409VDQ9_9AGAR|nr:hypothetical protein CVT24_008611 [Panaeolus cyanescens]